MLTVDGGSCPMSFLVYRHPQGVCPRAPHDNSAATCLMVRMWRHEVMVKEWFEAHGPGPLHDSEIARWKFKCNLQCTIGSQRHICAEVVIHRGVCQRCGPPKAIETLSAESKHSN